MAFFLIKAALGLASAATEAWLYRWASCCARRHHGDLPSRLLVLAPFRGFSLMFQRLLVTQHVRMQDMLKTTFLHPGCRAVARRYRPALAHCLLLFLCTTSGMFASSTSMLPSSFTLYALTAAAAGMMEGSPYRVIAAAAIGAGCA